MKEKNKRYRSCYIIQNYKYINKKRYILENFFYKFNYNFFSLQEVELRLLTKIKIKYIYFFNFKKIFSIKFKKFIRNMEAKEPLNKFLKLIVQNTQLL